MAETILEHPLFLLLVSAVFTGLFLPWITRRWQLWQKELELKTELVAEISEVVMSAAMDAELAQESSINADAKSGGRTHIDAYRDLKVDSCIIGSKLHAYFPDESREENEIHKKWKRFSDELVDYFKRMCNLVPGGNVVQANEKNNLLNTKADIIKEILATKMTGWRT